MFLLPAMNGADNDQLSHLGDKFKPLFIVL